MEAPQIGTAIPKRRYQLGEFSVALLGDIESKDEVQYHYILALIPEGQAKPNLYVTAEKNRRSEAAEGSHRMRLMTESQVTVLDSSDLWADEEAFTSAALKVVASVLGLDNVEPYRLM